MKILNDLWELVFWNYLYEKRPSYLLPSQNEELITIFNGPSASVLYEKLLGNDTLLEEIRMKSDILMVNKTIIHNKEAVFTIKPNYFSLVDPIFWTDTKMKKEIEGVLENISWEMAILTTQKSRFVVTNPKIHIIRLSSCILDKEGRGVYKLYNRNMCVPTHQNVAVSSLFFGITKKYSTINVWGLDYSNIIKLRVGINNKLFIEQEYAYHAKPVILEGTSMLQELINEKKAFDGFHRLRLYADENKVKIINWCPDSFVDVFEKKSP